MKATLLGLLAVGCTASVPTQQPVTVAHVDVSNVHCSADCPSVLELYQVCVCAFDRVEPSTGHLDVETGTDAADIAQLVQIQYAGAVTSGDRPHLDYVLEQDAAVEVNAAFDHDAV